MIKRISMLAAALALGVAVAYGAAASGATDPNGCVLHQGNHCKRLAEQGGGDPTTTDSTTTDGTSTAATTGSTTTATTTTGATTTTTTTTTTGKHGKRKPGGVPTPTPPFSSSGVSLVDKEWVCPGPVNITGTVSVTIDQNGSGDAVKLANGCTGYINRIVVTQYQGDGIHIANAHDLTIGSVYIRCYAHAPLKHQDGIQVLGGSNVTVNNADVGCYSANNSQVWINDGAGGNGPGGVPTDVIFNGGHFQGYYNNGEYGPGGSYGVSIGNSVRTGFRNAVICPNAHTGRQLNIGSATDPVDDGNQLPSSC